MKSIKIQLIVPDDLDVEHIAQVLDCINEFHFAKIEGSTFQVELKHSMIQDNLFIFEEKE